VSELSRRPRSLRRVGLNLLYLVPGQTGGMEAYARRLVPALVAAAGDVQFVAFLNREGYDDPSLRSLGDGVHSVRLDVSGQSRFSRVAAEQLLLPRLIRRHEVDLLHSLGSTAPAWLRSVSVVTVHDVIYVKHPQAHSRRMRMGMRLLVPLGARRADRIIADSKSAASEIAAALGIPGDRIDVVYLGGLPAGAATEAAELKERFRLDRPIVLSASARRGHKNLYRLLQAFAGIRTRPLPVLVVPGYSTSLDSELRRETHRLGIEERVRFLEWVTDADLEGLYRIASCFVFPSLAEGFGLPVLEAMERGVPVAASRASAIPEVGGRAVRYFDPLSVPEMREAVEELLSDRAVADELAAAGRRQAGKFSWERTAEETLQVYERAWTQRARTG
jgi:glycosyltransferase involved in cell wall biosynthesis